MDLVNFCKREIIRLNQYSLDSTLLKEELSIVSEEYLLSHHYKLLDLDLDLDENYISMSILNLNWGFTIEKHFYF